MLRSLHIRNYVLIDTLDIEFPNGLVIVSGPTGAGKSLIIGALGLLAGERSDAGAIAEGAESLVVEGEFISDSAELAALCTENDLEYDDGHFLIRRTVARSGRSRAFVNDSPVPLSLLARFGSSLVDIHSQHDTLLLRDSDYQLSVLDGFAGNAALLDSCRQAWNELRSLEKRAEELRQQLMRSDSESEYNTALYQLLERASLREGELAELEKEQYQLANAAQIKELLDECLHCFEGDEESAGINASLLIAHKALSKLSSYMPDMASLAERLEQARIELKDISSDVEDADAGMDCSPERLQWVEDRMSSLYALMKRCQCGTEAELLAKRDELASLAVGADDLREQLESVQKAAEASGKKLRQCCAALHEAREKAAVELSARIESQLAMMELEDSRFIVSLTPCECGPDGSDAPAFLFASSGQKPAPVAKCASGGELSRIMLALKSVMSGFMQMPSIVFDEIDTGVSGSVADKMGSVICDMGSRMQVFAITHLPQVAAKGKAHFLVGKTNVGGRVSSSIIALDEQGRVQEIARMLSGADITPEALSNAKALIRG